MAESVSTENVAVAHVFATVELLRLLPEQQRNKVHHITNNYKLIHEALREVFQEEYSSSLRLTDAFDSTIRSSARTPGMMRRRSSRYEGVSTVFWRQGEKRRAL